MSRKSVLQCDQCGKQCDETRAVNWLQLLQIGNVVRKLNEQAREGVFCSPECASRFLEKEIYRETNID